MSRKRSLFDRFLLAVVTGFTRRDESLGGLEEKRCESCAVMWNGALRILHAVNVWEAAFAYKALSARESGDRSRSSGGWVLDRFQVPSPDRKRPMAVLQGRVGRREAISMPLRLPLLLQ